MIRAIWYLCIVAALAIAAVWLADNPGNMRLQWQGYVVETSAALLIAAFALVAVIAAVLYRIWVVLHGVPAYIGQARKEGRRRRGYVALTRGMVAVAAGDAAEARAQGDRADGLLGDPSLTMLLSAQAAQLNGDDRAAEKFFQAMLERPEMEFLGLRGLLSQATHREDPLDALVWARRAYQLQPKSEWLAATLFDLLTGQSLWAEAETTLASAIKNKLVAPVVARRRLAVLGHLLSLQAEASGDNSKALKKAKKAFEAAPDFTPGAVHYGHLLLTANKRRKARAVIEQSWALQPHGDLAAAYWPAVPAEDALDRLKAAQKLTQANAEHFESRLLLAGRALEAGLWGDARRNLQDLIDASEHSSEPLTVTVCTLMAQLEEQESGDLAAARQWLFRVGSAAADLKWVCRDCGNTARQWTPHCGKCQTFDSFAWSRPLNIPVIPLTSQASQAPVTLEAVADEPASPELPAPDLAALPPGTGSQDIDEKSPGA